MRKLRRIIPDQIYSITNRCAQEKFLLRPDPECNELVGMWLAKALSKFGAELMAFVAMSNHYHLLVRAPRSNLDAFVGYFQGNVAKAVNRLRGRSGPFWQRRYSCIPVLDSDALEDRLVYILANPVRARLAGSIRAWPGMSSLPELAGRRPRVFHWLDKTRWRRAGCPRDQRPFLEAHELRHTPLPHLASLPTRRRRHRVLLMIREQEAALARERRAEGLGLMPRGRVRRQNPEGRPRNPKRSPSPLCHATSPETRRAYEALWREFVAQYRMAADELHERKRLVLTKPIFPRGSYPPRMPRRWAFTA